MQRLTRFLFTLLIYCFFYSHQSMAQQWEVARAIQSIDTVSSHVEVLAMEVSNGQYYMAGRFTGTVSYTDFTNTSRTTSSSGNFYDMFVARADNTGRIYWFAKGGSTNGEDQANDIIVLGNNVIVCGYAGAYDFSSSSNAVFTSAAPATATCSFLVNGTGTRKAFAACFNVTSGGAVWATGFHGGESEAKGITKDPSGSTRFLMTGYFSGNLTYGVVNRTGGTTTNCMYPCSVTSFNTSSQPSSAYNTFVTQMHNTGCSNWFNKLTGMSGSDWNAGEDIVSHTDNNGNHVYVAGVFSGELRQATYNPNQVVAGNTGYHVIMSTTRQQAGYLLELDYNGSGWSAYGGPCAGNPIGGFIDWNGNNTTPVYTAQKIETNGAGSVSIQGLAVKGISGYDPIPVVAGRWISNAGAMPSLYLNHQGSSVTLNGATSGAYDAFVCQYPGNLLSCNWANAITGAGNHVSLGGDNDAAIGFSQNKDGSGCINYNANGEIVTSGSFTFNCTVGTTSGSPVNLNVSSGLANDIDAMVIKYNQSGGITFAESLKGSCNGQLDFGTVACTVFNTIDGGYFAGYSWGDIGVNNNNPATEITLLNSNNNNATMTYYGKRTASSCLSLSITQAPIPLTTLGTFSVTKPWPALGQATVYYNLPAGFYMLAYRNPATSNQISCNNGQLPGWNLVPLTLTSATNSSMVISGLSNVIYEWVIQSSCPTGGWGDINTSNILAAKRALTAIDEPQTTEAIKVYPNPAKHTFTVSLSHSTSKADYIKVVDLSGRVCIHQKADTQNPQSIIDISSLIDGLYLVEVIGEQGEVLHQGKVVKQSY